MSSTITKPKFLIVGAGIGWLTLAAILEKANISYEIFKKASALKLLGSAIAVGPPVMPMLTQLGIADQAIAQGVQVAKGVLHSDKKELLLELGFIEGTIEK
ncbi:hypothetical protein BGZ49_000759 [Haplosporangium sp. Z 27]|nr:hypothetical protein BGZ49_000759 [Haplosporangium sp. Z 27]